MLAVPVVLPVVSVISVVAVPGGLRRRRHAASKMRWRPGFGRATSVIDSIAVLPLANTSNDPNTEYLSDGISEALINSLTELQQLRVVARSTAFRYKGKEIDPQAVGRELSVRLAI